MQNARVDGNLRMPRDKERLDDFFVWIRNGFLGDLMPKFALMSRITCDCMIVVCLRGIALCDDSVFEKNARCVCSVQLIVVVKF